MDKEKFEEKVIEAFGSQAGTYDKNMAGMIPANREALNRWVYLFNDTFRMKVMTGLSEAAGRGILIFKSIVENKLRIFLAPDDLKIEFDLIFWKHALTLFADTEPADKSSFFSKLEKDIETDWWALYGPMPMESYTKRVELMNRLSAHYSSF